MSDAKPGARTWLLLHGAIFLYSVNTVCAKMASAEIPLSLPFIGWMAADVLLLGIYALFWQQIMKKIELSVGYANKAVGLLWALLWSVLLFRDRVTPGKVLGIGLIIAGCVLMNTGGTPAGSVTGTSAGAVTAGTEEGG